jgi:hypothetical protein
MRLAPSHSPVAAGGAASAARPIRHLAAAALHAAAMFLASGPPLMALEVRDI